MGIIVLRLILAIAFLVSCLSFGVITTLIGCAVIGLIVAIAFWALENEAVRCLVGLIIFGLVFYIIRLLH